MTLEEYQKFCISIWTGSKITKYTLRDNYIMSVGLGGETGEVLEILKKSVRGRKKVDTHELTLEMGDVLYYMMMICAMHNIKPSELMNQNVKKLQARYAKRK